MTLGMQTAISGFPQRVNPDLEPSDHRGEVIGRRSDKRVDVDVPVAVNDAVTQSGGSTPSHLRVRIPHLGGYLARGLSEKP